MWHPAVFIRCSVLWWSKVPGQKFVFSCKFSFKSYLFGLYLTEIARGIISPVYETWHPAAIIRCSVFQGNKVYLAEIELTSKFLLAFYVLGLYVTGIASGTTSRVCETWHPTVQSRRSVLREIRSISGNCAKQVSSHSPFMFLGSTWPKLFQEQLPEFAKHGAQPFRAGVRFCGEIRSINRNWGKQVSSHSYFMFLGSTWQKLPQEQPPEFAKHSVNPFKVGARFCEEIRSINRNWG